MRRSETLAATLAILAIAACSGDSATGVRPDAASSLSASRGEASQGNERSIRGGCDAHIVSTVPLTQFTVREVVTGPCQISHLGRTTIYLQQVIDFRTLVGTSEVVTFTAANGDVLRATSITQGTPTGPSSFALAGTFFFNGGTGRFEHATGRANFAGSADFVTGRAVLAMSGHITYDASDRGDD